MIRLRGSFAVAMLVALSALAQVPKFKVIKIAKVGGEGRWDYLKLDTQNRKLYISRSTHVMVINADTLTAEGDIPDTQGVHGIALAPRSGHGFSSNGATNDVTVFDLKGLSSAQRVKVGTGPDAIIYDEVSRRVFTFNARSHDATAIGELSLKVEGTIPLGGKPEYAVPDGEGHMFVNIEDTAEVVKFDTRALKQITRWKITGCEDPTGLALDRRHARLFSVCGNQKMAVIDSNSGQEIAILPIGAGVDGVAFDPERQLAFSTNGRDGTMTVVYEESPSKFTVVQTVPTARGARTVELDSKTHNLYTITAKSAPSPNGQATIVPDSFEVLVVGEQK